MSPRRMRMLLIWNRDNGICWLCGEPVSIDIKSRTHPLRASLDHVVPACKGGPGTEDNFRISHAICNSVRASQVNNDPNYFQRKKSLIMERYRT